jgi:hypothetical protein
MSSSTRSKSQRGTSGLEEMPLDQKQLLLPSSPSLPPSEAAEVAEDSAERKQFKSGKIFLSPQDIKLARKMSGHISETLGLNSRSRSYRV